ncbi:phosphotransferase [Candidatus Shapirobacteria bacterium]|nr:phosphotransferase [Candidatus Shapirobacteria bacterium]
MSPEEKFFRLNFDNLISTINHKTQLKVNAYSVYESGQSSIVANIETDQLQPAVLKTGLNGQALIWEANALNHWRQAINAPQVLQISPATTELPAYIIYQRINHPRLKEISPQSRIASGLSQKMGSTLATIHNLETPIESGLFPTLTTPSEITTASAQRVDNLVKAGTLLPRHQATINRAMSTITSSSVEQKLCHGDFLAYNLFSDGQSLIVFDPDTIITDPMYDLANTTLNTIAEVVDFGQQEAQSIIAGYESKRPVDYQLLQAFFTVQCIKKIEKWCQKNLTTKVARTICFLESPPDFLRKNKN